MMTIHSITTWVLISVNPFQRVARTAKNCIGNDCIGNYCNIAIGLIPYTQFEFNR